VRACVRAGLAERGAVVKADALQCY
jgi:hypothetical protein